MLTKSDIQLIKDLLDSRNKEIVSALTKLVTRSATFLKKELVSNEKFEKQTREIIKREIRHLPTKDEIEIIVDKKLDEKIKFLPTKDDFYSKMDELMGEVKAVRETQEIHSNTNSEINDRLDNLEKVFKTS